MHTSDLYEPLPEPTPEEIERRNRVWRDIAWGYTYSIVLALFFAAGFIGLCTFIGVSITNAEKEKRAKEARQPVIQVVPSNVEKE